MLNLDEKNNISYNKNMRENRKLCQNGWCDELNFKGSLGEYLCRSRFGEISNIKVCTYVQDKMSRI